MNFSRKQQQVLGLFFSMVAIWIVGVVYAETCQTLNVRSLAESDPPDLLFYLDSSIDVNRASTDELQLLPNIGPILAERIIEYREQQGHFLTAESLESVKGIGPKTVQKIHYYLIFPE